jgi:hypothetical protein
VIDRLFSFLFIRRLHDDMMLGPSIDPTGILSTGKLLGFILEFLSINIQENFMDFFLDISQEIRIFAKSKKVTLWDRHIA